MPAGNETGDPASAGHRPGMASDGQDASGLGSAKANGQGVKINIVNVHNEFNIQNNIIIQQPNDGQGNANRGGGKASTSGTGAGGSGGAANQAANRKVAKK